MVQLRPVSFPSCVGIVPLRLFWLTLLRGVEKASARIEIRWECQHIQEWKGRPLMRPYWLNVRKVAHGTCGVPAYTELR